MNKNLFVGRLTKDPEVKMVNRNGEDLSVGKISLAVENNFKNAEGQYVTTFINNMTVIGAKTKLLSNLCKGRKILVECHLINNNYTDKNGNKVYAYDFIVDQIDFLDAKPQSNQPQSNQPQSNQPQSNQPQSNQPQNPQSQNTYGMPPQGGYQPLPQGNVGQVPQGGYQPLPQGNFGQIPPQPQMPYGMPPQGQIPQNYMPSQSQQFQQPTLEEQFRNQQPVEDPQAIFGSGVAGSNFK